MTDTPQKRYALFFEFFDEEGTALQYLLIPGFRLDGKTTYTRMGSRRVSAQFPRRTWQMQWTVNLYPVLTPQTPVESAKLGADGIDQLMPPVLTTLLDSSWTLRGAPISLPIPKSDLEKLLANSGNRPTKLLTMVADARRIAGYPEYPGGN